jgi:hypothetical protein
MDKGNRKWIGENTKEKNWNMDDYGANNVHTCM